MNNSLGLRVNTANTTDVDSPRGWRYVLLHSPKAALLSPSALPFLVIFFGTGFIIGGTWNKVGTRMSSTSAGTPLPKSKHITSSIWTNNMDANFVVDDGSSSYLRKIKPDVALPVAWLMSFPNSGTSYTSLLVRTTTGTNTGTNYGTENVGEDGTSVAVFKDSPRGPFYSSVQSKSLIRPSKGYLLTKTHCGSRCNQCSPEKSVENINIFINRCFEGSYITKDENNNAQELKGTYSQELLAKAVHLIRDPFDNVVSRFHLSYKHFLKKNETDKLEMYPRSREGFRAFCKQQGRQFYYQEKDSKFYTDVFDEVKAIPCHADIFRYIQWHNLAFTTTWDLNIPTLILHYENYTNNFDETKDMLLDFLDQDGIHEPPLFVTGKTYREYYTDSEIGAVGSMFKKLALEKTWYHTKHYFD